MCKRLLLYGIFLVAACQSAPLPQTTTDTVKVKSYNIIPLTRKTIRKEPVADYVQQVDQLNNWKFRVSIYETSRTFHFNMVVQYKELRVSDSLNIPDFGTEPKMMLRKGPETYSCIIGFSDKTGTFIPYRKASIQNDQLRIKTVQGYFVGSYKTVKK